MLGLTLLEWLYIVISLIALIPASVLFKEYFLTRILDYLYFAIFFVVGSVAQIIGLLVTDNNYLLLYQILFIAINTLFFLLFLHAVRIRWEKTPLILMLTISLAYFALIILIVLWESMVQPERAKVLFWELPHGKTLYYPDGAGITTSAGNMIYSTDYYYLTILFAFLILSVTLFVYIRLEPVYLTDKITLSRKLWIVAYSTFMIWGGFMLPWAPDDTLVVGSVFLVISLILIVYIALKIPESMLISKVQIRRAILLYDRVKQLTTKEEREEFGMGSLVDYLQSIPEELLDELDIVVDLPLYKELGFSSEQSYFNFLGYIKGRRKLGVQELAWKFHRKKEEIVDILTKINEREIIEGSISEENIEIVNVQPSDLKETGWNDDEIYTLGYCTLKKVLPLNELHKNLNFKKDFVEQTIFSAIYKDRMEAFLGIKEPDFKELYLTVTQYPRINVYHQITHWDIPPKEWEQTIRVNYEDVPSIPGFTNNQLILQLAKTISGILIIRKEMSFSSLLDQITIPGGFDKSLSKSNIIWRILSILSLSNFMEIVVDRSAYDQWYIYTKCDMGGISHQALRPVYGYEEFNYDALLGLLASKTSIRLSDISKQMSSPSLKWTNNEIQHILANLTIEGVIDGILDDDNILTLQTPIEISKIVPTDDAYALSKNERLLIGVLLSQSRSKVKYIAEVIGKTEAEAKQVFYSLINQGQISGEISRGGMIILQNMPSLPPLSQAYKLPKFDREILGYLIAKRQVKFSQYEQIWNKNKLEIERTLLNCAGSGLVSIDLEKNEVKYVTHELSQPPAPLDEKTNPDLSKVLQFLKSQEDAVSLSIIAENLKMDKSSVIKKISLLVGTGYYPKATLSDEMFDKGSKIRVFSVVFTCFNCGAGFDEQLNT
ncbi:MAG: hypothetical protein ACXAD7_22235, partial [Candidatus Kariarchaeaceae archaeon]